MATLKTRGVEDFLRQLKQFGQAGVAAIPAVLQAGADEAARQMQSTSMWHDRTGGLRNSIVQSEIYGKGTGRYIDIYPDGMTNDSKPQRYAEIGFVLEYGRSNMPPRPWIRPAVEDHAEEIGAAMRDKWEALGRE